MSERHSLPFDAGSKVICTGAEVADQLLDALGPVTVFAADRDDDGIGLRAGGKAHRLNAPANGACVLVGAPDDPLLADLLSLWSAAALPPPPSIDPAHPALAEEVLRALLSAMEDELVVTANAATGLDAQIAVLREEMEDARATSADLRHHLRQGGNLAVESFHRAPSGRSLPILPEAPTTQPLPLPGHMICGIGIAFDRAKMAALDGAAVTATLTAREDGTVLATWLIREADVSPGEPAWAILALEGGVARKYRKLDLRIEAAATDQPPELLLAGTAGDDRLAVAPGEMLALRLWTGQPFTAEGRNDAMLLPASPDQVAHSRFRIPLPPRSLEAARKLTTPTEELNWLRIQKRDIFCHPAVSTPSVVAIPLELGFQAAGLSTTLELAHDKAFPTRFGLLCSALDLDAQAVLDLLDRRPEAGPDLLALAPWVELVGGTARGLTLDFARPAQRTILYLATRVTGGRNDYAHAWFREVMLLQAGVVHADAA